MLAAATLLLSSSLPSELENTPALARDEAPGRVIGSARGQVAWLDLLAPRTTPLTQLVRPSSPADVAAAPGVDFVVASIVGAFSSTDAAVGGDLMQIDLSSGASRIVESRQSDSESLDLPAIWPDGSGILYQRSNLGAVVAMPGQAQPQYQSRVEQLDADGRNPVPLLDDARYPGLFVILSDVHSEAPDSFCLPESAPSRLCCRTSHSAPWHAGSISAPE